MIPGAVLGWDMGAALAMAKALGIDALIAAGADARDRGGDGALVKQTDQRWPWLKNGSVSGWSRRAAARSGPNLNVSVRQGRGVSVACPDLRTCN